MGLLKKGPAFAPTSSAAATGIGMSDFAWDLIHLHQHGVLSETLVREVHRIFLDGFGLVAGWSHQGIRAALANSTVLGLVRGPEAGRYYGYAMYLVPEPSLQGTSLLWENAICLRKESQGHGLSKKVLTEVHRLLPDRPVGWLGGRTQNPLVMRRYSGFGRTFPFAQTYATPAGLEVMQFLRKHVPEVRDVPRLEPDSGVCRGVYKDGRLGDYPVDAAKAVSEFELRLSEWGFDRDAGDAVVVVAKVGDPPSLQ